MEKIVIAIDGPAGAGKTTIAKELAKKLDIPYFSTGSMYRALALKCINNNLDPESEETANYIAENTKIALKYENGLQYVILDGVDVTNKLYTDKVSEGASKISVHPVVRQKLVKLQRETANSQSVIMDGRDIGSNVLPMANYKFYLDANVEIRAKRRFDELIKKGSNVTFEEVLADMKDRDYRDKNRKVSPLVVCEDAIVIDSSNLTIDEVINEFFKYIGGK